MDYSLLLGVHDLDRAVEDAQQAIEEETDDDDYDSGGSAGIALTPPDSPGCMRQVKLDEMYKTNLTSPFVQLLKLSIPILVGALDNN